MAMIHVLCFACGGGGRGLHTPSTPNSHSVAYLWSKICSHTHSLPFHSCVSVFLPFSLVSVSILLCLCFPFSAILDFISIYFLLLAFWNCNEFVSVVIRAPESCEVKKYFPLLQWRSKFLMALLPQQFCGVLRSYRKEKILEC